MTAARSYVVERIAKFCDGEGENGNAQGGNGSGGKVFALCLSGRGRVMSSLLESLVRAHQEGALSFRRVAVFATDEFVVNDRLHPCTQRHYLWHKLFKHVDIESSNVHILDGSVAFAVTGAGDADATEQWQAECARYEQALLECGGIQLLVTESGRNGEVGRNAPGASLSSRARKVLLNYDAMLEIADAQFDGDLPKVPRMCLTAGVGTLMGAQEAVLLFEGLARSNALESCVEHPINHMWPVSIFQSHPCCMIVCDEPATMELRMKTVRYFEGLQRTAQLNSLDAKAHLTKAPSRHRLLKMQSSESAGPAKG
jgi:glucosamine-6-phosphate deaminase